jgi:hypothetical protein
MWQIITSAPQDRDLELAVIDKGDTHALAFPCRRAGDGWINALTHARIDVHPTHWRPWADQPDRPDLSF